MKLLNPLDFSYELNEEFWFYIPIFMKQEKPLKFLVYVQIESLGKVFIIKRLLRKKGIEDKLFLKNYIEEIVRYFSVYFNMEWEHKTLIILDENYSNEFLFITWNNGYSYKNFNVEIFPYKNNIDLTSKINFRYKDSFINFII